MKKSITTFLLCCLLFTSTYAMTHLRIEKNDTSEELVQLNTIRTIQFQGDDVQFNFKNGTSDLFAASTLKSLQFSSIPSDIQKDKSSEFFFYPNPATDYLYLKNIGLQDIVVSIYQIDGVLVHSSTQETHEGIYIGNLSSGIYLLQINKEVFKFRKL